MTGDSSSLIAGGADGTEVFLRKRKKGRFSGGFSPNSCDFEAGLSDLLTGLSDSLYGSTDSRTGLSGSQTGSTE
jgi:hypothetical protein